MKYQAHHLYKRKRIYKKLEEYPHSKKWIRTLDKFLLIVAVIGPLMSLPQIIKIYHYKDAAGISILSWSLYALFDIPWIIYGFAHKEKPIIIAYTFWFLTNLTVIIGALLYQ